MVSRRSDCCSKLRIQEKCFVFEVRILDLIENSMPIALRTLASRLSDRIVVRGASSLALNYCSKKVLYRSFSQSLRYEEEADTDFSKLLEDSRDERVYAEFLSGNYHQTLAYHKASPNYDSSMVIIVKNYGENSFVLTGDTLQNKDKIKELGGKWNSNTKGWLFPLSKKTVVLAELKTLCEVEETDEAEDVEEEPPAKRQKTDENNEENMEKKDKFIQLDKKGKRVSLSTFGGKCGIDIREYYNSNGEMKPGSKVQIFKTFFFKLALIGMYYQLLTVF